MLEISNLHVEVGGREVLQGVNLKINDCEINVLLGPNGSGKTTLLRRTIIGFMGFGSSRVTSVKIRFNGVDVTEKQVHKQAQAMLGMGIMFQRPPTIIRSETQQVPHHNHEDRRRTDICPRRMHTYD